MTFGPPVYYREHFAANEFDRHTDDAIALTKPEREPAAVIDIRTRERVR